MRIKLKVESLKWKGFIVFLLAMVCIPLNAQELLNYPLDTVNGEEVYKYEVEKSIGLYRIGVNFNVSQMELIRLNPQLRERGLHYGETLLIPTGRKVEKRTQTAAQTEHSVQTDTVKEPVAVVVDSVVVVIDTVAAEITDTVSVTEETDPRRVVELALMLPFESQHTKRSGNAERMMEFYQGALLALHGHQNDSIVYRLRVYDTERSERRVNALCESTELDQVRGILGLVYPIQITRMVAWSEAHQVPVLLPFSDDMNLHHHPHIYQFNSPDADESNALAQWILANEDSLHCVAIDVKESELSASIRSLRKQLQVNETEMKLLALKDLLNDSVAYALDSTKENLIILHSDRYQQVRMLIPHLKGIQHDGFRVRIVSQYSWQKEAINLPQVYTTKFNSDLATDEYDALWSQVYVGEHVSDAPRYDLLGYDLMNELIHLVTDAPSATPLQSPIVWEATSEEDGWQNTYVKVVGN